MSVDRHQRVMQILADAIECDTGRRREVLERSCGGDESLRSEVERLLGHKHSAASFLEEPLLSERDRQRAPEAESLVGRQFGPYRITGEVGRGGMGTVYLAARSDDEYQKRAAIKLVRPGMDTDQVLRRFRNERQILANLDHQNIARLFDGGTTEEGLPYLVMEYVEGDSINLYADARKLPTAERLKLFLTVCEAVQYVHHHGVIHRDLKPGNILVSEDGVPKLLDFGIAEGLRADSPAGKDETASAWRVMTPEYASPEQIRGEPVTEASDVYSLGAVLYELLTGHRPHNFKGLGPDEVARVVSIQEPERPSDVIGRAVEGAARTLTPESICGTRDVSPERLRRSLRGDLDNILLMALRKEPERRYASVEKFAEDIRRHLEGRPVQARKDSLPYRGAKFFKRHQVSALATLAAALLCLLLGVMLAGLFESRPVRRESIAVLPLVNAGHTTDAETISDGITDNLIDSLSSLPNLAVPAHNSVFRFKGQAVDPQAAGRALGVETVLTGSVADAGDGLSIDLSMTDVRSGQVIWGKQYTGRRSEIIPMQERVVRDVSEKLGVDLGAGARKRYTENPEAYQLYLKGRYFWNKRDGESLKKGIEYFRQAVAQDPGYALAYSGMADSYTLLVVYGETDENLGPARASARKALELDASLAEPHVSLAALKWLFEWDWAGAEIEFKRAIGLNPQYATARHWYGLYLAEMGRFDEALAEERRALNLDPLSLIINADYGRVLYYARRYDESLEQYRKTLEMDPNFQPALTDIAYVYEQKGMYDEMADKLKPGHAGELKAAYHEQGVKGFWLKWLETIRREHSDRDYSFAEVYAQLGEKDRAFDALDRAYEKRIHAMAQLRVNPMLDPLRSDPRFSQLLRRMNLAP